MLTLIIGSAHGQDLPPRQAQAEIASLPEAPLAGGMSERLCLSSIRTKPSGVAPQVGSHKVGIFEVPNFRSYSADTILPSQTVRQKYKTGLQDSFGYYAIVLVGAEAGIHQASNQYPAFRQGAAGYGRYYWHNFADQADENLWVVSILPSALHEDSRYYRLGHGGFLKRTVYSLSRTVVTRSDSGGSTLNVSELLGSGAAAGISSTYYPVQYRTWTKTGQRWLSNAVVDGATFAVKEFWPDVDRFLFHHHD